VKNIGHLVNDDNYDEDDAMTTEEEIGKKKP
jgi:hypothetical protein